jgi:hypothetical protein
MIYRFTCPSKETYPIVFCLYNCLYIPLSPLFSPIVEKYKIHIVSRSPYQKWLITRHKNENILPVNERRRSSASSSESMFVNLLLN